MGTTRLRMRLVTTADAEAVGRLQREVGFKAHSPAGWRWCFEENPAREAGSPQGWVIEGDAGIEGYLGNIPQAYVWDGRPVRAATCCGYVVRPSARGDSLKLLQAWFKQPEVDLFLSTTANAESEELYRVCKAEVPADPSFRRGLIWVGSDRAALREHLGVWGGLAPVARLARRLTGFAHAPAHPRAREVVTRDPRAIDERYDALWALLAGRPGLRLRRDAATLRWLLADPDAPPPAVLELAGPDGLEGYAIVARHHPGGGSASQLRLLDLGVRPDREELVAALVRAAVDRARALGAGLLYAPPAGAELAGLLDGLGGEPRERAHDSHFLRSARRAETAALAAPGTWRASGLDGDIPFCLEAPG